MRLDAGKNLPLSIFIAFSYYNKIAYAFKILTPVFLFWRNYTTLGPFHFNPHFPSWNAQVWHAFGHTLGF